MITIDFHVKNLDKARWKRERLARNLPTANKATISEIADRLADEMRILCPYWHGTLKSSIDVVPIDRDSLGVKAIFYARFVERGHGAVGKHIPKMLRWAFEKSRVPYKAYLTLRLYGAVPHPFINPAIENLKPQLHGILRKHISFGIKKSVSG